ncbi:MAG: dephospho-CoA kinase [Candidatus Diapherotrites archaeon]
MIAIGITGGIACGKSTVARMFRTLGAELIDADEIVRSLYRKPAVAAKIKKAFGSGAVSARGGKNAGARRETVNRRFLTDLVFSDARKRGRLNAIVHPLVVRELKKRIAKSRTRVVVVDLPLLFEANLSKMFDFVIVVRAGRKPQFARLRARGLSPKEANSRILSQMPLREKVKLADFVISTEGTKKQTALRVGHVCRELRLIS